MEIKNIFKNIWVQALILLGLFLATNRYIYGWDDQALEIPLLKSFIDPALYAGDYYVESLKSSFTSYFYILLSKVCTVRSIPEVYFGLYLFSRYFLFFFCLKLWNTIGENKAASFFAVTASFWVGRTEEFLYRTFSHQEFTLPVIVAGIWLFYKNNFVWASLVLGVATNFHALYALFPMIYLCVYLLSTRQWKKLCLASATYLLSAAPFLAWALPQRIAAKIHANPSLYENWVDVFLLACPQNFLFQTRPLTEVFANLSSGLNALAPYLFLACLYGLHCLLNRNFRIEKKHHAYCLTAFGFIIISFLFTYVWPSKFIINLNLIRHTQYINFLLVGITAIWAWKKSVEEKHSQVLWIALVFMLLTQAHLLSVLLLVLATGMILLKKEMNHLPSLKSGKETLWFLSEILFLAFIFYLALFQYDIGNDKFRALLFTFTFLTLYFVVLSVWRISPKPEWSKRIFVIVPLIVMGCYFVILHVRYVEVTTKAGGFWQLQRNWEDMQHHVQERTPKDAMLLIPYNMEMGGFRIGSERKIVASYRDCGIVGFDYNAVLQWRQRIQDIESFKVFNKGDLRDAIVHALVKYKVDYIVFMRYNAPKNNATFPAIYANEIFSLHKVTR